MKSGARTIATRNLQLSGLTLADTLNPEKRNQILSLPGVGLKMLALLQDDARQEGIEAEHGELLDRMLFLLRAEWVAGAEGLPGHHHLDPAKARKSVARFLGI